jgi:hypothetical protein
MESVLSIDFDYFQDITDSETFSSYPDGIDLPTEISSLVWASKYATKRDKEKIMSVNILQNELDILKEILLSQNSETKIMVRNSHLDIYYWIHKLISTDQKFSLRNIDMHHDLFNGNRFVDCGNWVEHIFDDYGRNNVNFKWISNPISLDMYGFKQNELKGLSINTSLRDICSEKYDYIFMCRSDNWFPPHLDEHFWDIIKIMESHFMNVDIYIEKRDGYKGIVEEISSLTKPLMDRNMRKN